MEVKKWEIVSKLKTQNSKLKTEEIIDILLKNRGIKTDKEKIEFFDSTHPDKISLKSLDLVPAKFTQAINRIKKAKRNKEKVIIYGDYDADGVCATAILWEALDAAGVDVMPYIPERFSEGYGLNAESIKNIKTRTAGIASGDARQNSNVKLIITVDNGIVANSAVNEAKKLGVDVIITDHHEKGERYPQAHSIVHTTKIGGAGLAWVFAREVRRKLKAQNSKLKTGDGLDLVAIGTIADQIPLLGANRSFVKYGLERLNETKRVGIKALYKEATVEKGNVGTYEIGFVIAPRINAMGRLEHAIESLRLLCTKSPTRAKELAFHLGKTNKQRQKIVDEVVAHTKNLAEKRSKKGVIIIAHESYHEGVIGLAASRLVEQFWRPAIVLSKGKEKSKASARSISGFNIIKALRKLDKMLLECGGHPMAAGFSIDTEKIEDFSKKLESISVKLLTEEILTRKLKIDVELDFNQLNWDLMGKLKAFKPVGLGNPNPTFVTCNVNILDIRTVGKDAKHLKLKLEKDGKVLDAIAFSMGNLFIKLLAKKPIDLVYVLEENVWNNKKSLQLKVKDIKLAT